MPKYEQFNLPDLAEGLVDAEIIKWLVSPGDTVTLNQPIVEVETAKALTEIPSPYAGQISKLHGDEGTTVDVGQPLVTFDLDPDGSAPAEVAEEEEDTKVLVGYGPKKVSTKRRARKPSGSAPAAAQPAPVAEPARPVPAQAPAPQPPKAEPPAPAPAPALTATPQRIAVLAKPPVRKLAKDLGVDLTTITGTGPSGSITRDDVQSATTQAAAQASPSVKAHQGLNAAPVGGEERIPIKGVRKLTAQNMSHSAFTAPHVTEFLQLDVTATMEAVARLKTLPNFDGVKVSPLLLVAKAMLLAAKRHPMINSSWDEAAQEIVVKHYVNLGIAAATPRGLIVPNVKNAESLSLRELAEALNALTATAREGKTPPADMSGGTMTITNVGVFGVDTGTPILPPGESAILAFGAVRDLPWVHEGQVVPRKVTTLSLSFDHRIVDGELGSKFLADVGAFLADPGTRLLAWSLGSRTS
ncbi:dihydrolipoamide acetyltransferase family protein [Stackebrandtia nassauensis]|uniref:Dihydrolipoamide acetyltransferase component of pyruvate dehydrogenase complex n=1 Tax=Stackebrandtia nassauensis (strain DSM 44728 / CIP 108903 / NRRL B-16338 / NBRC 102104 / LLR-40K-21) TaxID=446470 RepID=D3Q1B4_STANL|nr:dihydrolipoamide acetyltransferase family protein [Stackebrandtia nassauensis]ADD45694.1 catalytic domain of components of various dehydrogenase complexes [Stackebrandtia nassauensis DSM 44728]